VYLAAECVH